MSWAIVKDAKEVEALGVPETVYKYRMWNDGVNNSVNRILSHREIRLTRPTGLLADYHECKVIQDYESVTESDLLKKAAERFDIEFPNAKPAFRHNQIRKYRKSMTFDDPDHRKEVEEYYYKKLDSSLGVFCTSMEFKDVKVWEHLGNLSKGYCVGLSTSKLYGEIFGAAGKVDYYDPQDPPKVKPISFSNNERTGKSMVELFSIPNTYSYEAEFRFTKLSISPDGTTVVPYTDHSRLINIPLDAYNCAILGSDISTEDREEILNICHDTLPEIPIYQAIFNDGNITLEKL